MLTLRPAAELSPSELLERWNAAYAGYLVPLTFDQAMLDRHIRRAGLDLERAVVGSVDGEDFGLSMAAFRQEGSVSRAWIGGFGIGEPFRRRGLATQLLTAHLERLDSVDEVWLEVIDANPAREVYRRCGFEEMRELLMFEGPLPAATGRGEDLSFEDLAARHAALNPVRPTWRRDLPTLEDAVTVEGAAAIGVEGGYGVALDQGERVMLFDAGAVDAAAGARLLDAVAARWPGKAVRIVDEPQESGIAAAFAAAGLPVVLRQVEMVRRRG